MYFTRAYEPWAIKLENGVKGTLEKAGITVKRFSGSLLKEPEAIRTQAGQPFKVYTPFWRAVVNSGPPARPLKSPSAIKSVDRKVASGPPRRLGVAASVARLGRQVCARLGSLGKQAPTCG